MEYTETYSPLRGVVFLDSRSEIYKPCKECGTLTPYSLWQQQQGYCTECYAPSVREAEYADN